MLGYEAYNMYMCLACHNFPVTQSVVRGGRPGGGGGRGDSDMKRVEMLVGNFELNP